MSGFACPLRLALVGNRLALERSRADEFVHAEGLWLLDPRCASVIHSCCGGCWRAWCGYQGNRRRPRSGVVAPFERGREPRGLADAKRTQLEVAPISGAAVNKVISLITSAAPETAERLGKAIAPADK